MTNTDFDFLAGHWDSRQRRLVKVLDGCDEWYEFDATLDCQVLLDGNGVFDVLRAPERDIEGTIESVSPASGSVFSLLPAENATGNFTKIVQRVPVRIAVPGEIAQQGLLRPGLSVVVSVDTRDHGGQATRTAQR